MDSRVGGEMQITGGGREQKVTKMMMEKINKVRERALYIALLKTVSEKQLSL